MGPCPRLHPGPSTQGCFNRCCSGQGQAWGSEVRERDPGEGIRMEMHRYTATDPGTQVHTETDSQTQTIRPQSLRNLDADPGAGGNRNTHTD